MGETPVSQHLPASHLRPAPPAARTQVPSTHYEVPKALLITGVFVASSKKKGLWSIVCPLPLLHNWNIARSLRAELLERFFVTLPLFLEALYRSKLFVFKQQGIAHVLIYLLSISHIGVKLLFIFSTHKAYLPAGLVPDNIRFYIRVTVHLWWVNKCETN